MRLSEADAKRLGIVIEGNRAWIATPASGDARTPQTQRPPCPLPKSEASSHRDPQRMIFNALEAVENLNVCWERTGLIPDRKFRADIYLPASRVIVEMDGFQFHRSKDAFQSDRMRQNLFVEHGFHVLRFFARQVLKDIDAVVDQILRVHKRYSQDSTYELHN